MNRFGSEKHGELNLANGVPLTGVHLHSLARESWGF